MVAAGVRHLCTVLSPFLLAEGYRRGWFHPDVLFKVGQVIVVLYAGAFVMRGLGRVSSVEYRKFCRLLTVCQQQPTASKLAKLKDYDYKVRTLATSLYK